MDFLSFINNKKTVYMPNSVVKCYYSVLSI